MKNQLQASPSDSRYLLIGVLLSLSAGLCDSLSGLLLMIAPGFALELMRVPVPTAESLVFIRFIGAFVFSVGSLYLMGLWQIIVVRRARALCCLLSATAWLRGVVCVFTTVALIAGMLPLPWVSVPLTDGLLAIAQVWLVRELCRRYE